MDARFASSCQRCGSPIRKGDAIRYVKGMDATHEQCGDPVVYRTREAFDGTFGVGRRPGNRRRGYSTYAARCAHEDYPCCGCDQ